MKTEFDDLDKMLIESRINDVTEELQRIDKQPIPEERIDESFTIYERCGNFRKEDGNYDVEKLVKSIRLNIEMQYKMHKQIVFLFNRVKLDSELEQIHNISMSQRGKELSALKKENEQLKDKLIDAMQKVIELTNQLQYDKRRNTTAES